MHLKIYKKTIQECFFYLEYYLPFHVFAVSYDEQILDTENQYELKINYFQIKEHFLEFLK